MENRSLALTAFIVPIALLLVGRSGLAPRAEQTETAPPGLAEAVPEAAAPRCGDAGPLQYRRGCILLEDFLGRPYESSDTAVHLDVLIATLPDPYDSRLDWAHDQYLEAIRRAFETSGFVTDRFWLPARRDSVWIPRGTGARDSVRRSLREAHPGAILFRGTRARAGQLRLLYLVGEIPTSGLHKDALAAALAERDRLLGVGPAGSGTDTIRIVGPVFSGSVQSLQQALSRRQGGTGRPVRIISGTATDVAVWSTLRSDRSVRFDATVHPDSTLNEILHHAVLDSMKIERRQVAYLRESSTQYGQAIGDVGTTGGGALVIPFPMSISSLRADYARFPEAEAGPAQPGAEAERPRLPLSLQDSIRPKESPPVYSALTTPTMDLVLEEITRTLRSHGIRAVVLQATDVRDKLFLGSYLRRQLRDVQLVTFETNALFLRSDYEQALRGMLVLSSYPLFLENQWWVTRPADHEAERLAFPSEGAAGVYNATLILLGNDSAVVDYGSPGPATARSTVPPVWLTVVGAGSFQPLRAFVDPDRNYVARVPAPEPQRNRALDPGPSAARYRLSFVTFAAWVFLALAVAVASVYLLYLDVRRARIWSYPTAQPPDPKIPSVPGGTTYRYVEEASLRIHAEIYTAALLAGMAGIFLPAVVLVWNQLRLSDTSGWGTIAGRIGVGLVAALWLVTFVTALARGVYVAVRSSGAGYRFAFRKGWSRSRQGWLWVLETAGRIALTFVGWGYLYFTVRYVWSLAGLGDPDGLRFRIFYLRAARLGSGVSPLLPLLLTGSILVAWSAWHLIRIHLLADDSTPFERAALRHRARVRDGAAREPADRALRDEASAVEEIRERLFRLFPDGRALILAVLLISILPWLRNEFVGSYEDLLDISLSSRDAFRVLFQFGVMASLVATAWAVYRLICVWRALEKCLRALEDSDLRLAFGRLPSEIARLTRLSVFDSPSRASIEAVEKVQWQQLDLIFTHQGAEIDEEVPGRAGRLRRVSSVGRAVVTREEPREHSTLLRRCEHHAVGRLLRELWAATLRRSAGAGAIREELRAALTRVWRHDAHARTIARAEALATLRVELQELWRDEPTEKDICEVIKALTGTTPRAGLGKRAKMDEPDTSSQLSRTYTGALGLWMRIAEELLAVAAVDYIEWVLRHMRRLALFLLLALVITITLLSSYPFQPQSLVKLLFFFILASTIGTLVLVINQMSRNNLLSRITATTAGKVEWDFGYVSNLLLFAGIPLLAALTAEFPQVREALFSWVAPLLRTMAKV